MLTVFMCVASHFQGSPRSTQKAKQRRRVMMAPSTTACNAADVQLGASIISPTDVHVSALAITAETLSQSERQQLGARLSSMARQLAGKRPAALKEKPEQRTRATQTDEVGAESALDGPPIAGAAAESAPEADGVAQEAAEALESKPKKLRGRARWIALVEGGRVLELQESTTMGRDPLNVYLRAMGVKLTRDQQADVKFLRDTVREKMRELGVTQWSKS